MVKAGFMYPSVEGRSKLLAMNGILQDLYQLQTLDVAGLPGSEPQAARLRAALPPGMLSHYERARARGKKDIALVSNQVCPSCRIRVPLAVTASLAAGVVQVCGNCGIYPCLPEPEGQPAAAGAEVAAPSGGRKRERAAGKPGAP